MTLLLLATGLVGLLLGLLGGGGSVLAVPVLVYLAGMEPRTAMATSLILVATTGFAALTTHARAGRVCWKTGLLFGAAGMAGAYGGGRLAALLPGSALLLIFAGIMLGTAFAMLRRAHREGRDKPVSHSFCPRHLRFWAIAFDGLGVGALAGLVGAGGGFLVVPALTLLGGLPMYAAVGTSLLVVTLQSSAALAGYVSHTTLDLEPTAWIVGSAVIGSLIGGQFAHRISQRQLRRVFGVFVALVACYVLYREMNWRIVLQLSDLIAAHREFVMGVLTGPALALLFLMRVRWGRRERISVRHERKNAVIRDDCFHRGG
jgi:uncharacterized membrane protein YfcA